MEKIRIAFGNQTRAKACKNKFNFENKMKNLRNRKTTCLKDENIVCNQTRAKLCKQAFNFKNKNKKDEILQVNKNSV